MSNNYHFYIKKMSYAHIVEGATFEALENWILCRS